jgi:hypothetical protein
MNAPTVKSRKPTCVIPFPLVLLEGEEKVMRKSRPARLTTGREELTMPIRFFEKIEFRPEPDGCWIWTGADSGGDRPYGISWDGERRVKAHRWAFLAAGGELPAGYEPDHTCRTPLCVRPSHMEAVTQLENIMRSDAPGPLAVRTNRCKRGHEFTPENTRRRGDGGRECRACQRMHRRAYKARVHARGVAA